MTSEGTIERLEVCSYVTMHFVCILSAIIYVHNTYIMIIYFNHILAFALAGLYSAINCTYIYTYVTFVCTVSM